MAIQTPLYLNFYDPDIQWFDNHQVFGVIFDR